MPPRQPLKIDPATGKAAPRRRPAAKPAPAKTIPPVNPPLTSAIPSSPQVHATPEPAKPAKKSAFSAFSLYPDLSMAIAMLEKRRTQLPPERAELIDKWVVSLNKVQQEMTHLRKLEDLTNALSRPVVSNANDEIDG